MWERAGVGGCGRELGRRVWERAGVGEGVEESWGRRVWERAGVGGCGRELG